jgi:hypothetical protein
MPYRSKAQHRLFRAKEARYELEKGTASRWAHETKGGIKKLPEKVRKKKARKSKKRRSAAQKAATLRMIQARKGKLGLLLITATAIPLIPPL